MENIKVICPHCLKINRIPKKDVYKKAVCGQCKGDLLDNKPIVADDSNFDYILQNSDLPIIVDFYTDWCGPCKMFAPTFIEVAKNFPLKVQFVKVNTEIAQNIAVRNRIRSIPTIVAFKNSNEIHRVNGAMQAPQFNQFVNQILAMTK